MPDRIALKARLVFPVAGPPLDGACVSMVDGRIVAVGPPEPGCSIQDLGDVAIIPGFVNAHTHLEFSDIRAPLGEPGMSLCDWIRLLVAHRRATGAAKVDPADTVARGLDECLRGGTTTVGDIATSDWRVAVAGRPQPRPETIVFRECIAPILERAEDAALMANEFLTAIAPAGTDAAPMWPALSPHAPYSVHRRLIVLLLLLADRFKAPLAMHLAESREEMDFLESGGGPFRDLLVDLGAWNPDPLARYANVLHYLQALSLAPRSLVIHGNYLDRAAVDFLASNAATMSVVYCPRTHAYFRHEPYPLAHLLGQGVSLALGTDSRASNPDLDMLAEMRHVARQHPDVPAARVLELATLGGAQALGMADRVGSLAPGKLANLAIVGLGDHPTNDPYDAIFATGAGVVQSWIAGRMM